MNRGQDLVLEALDFPILRLLLDLLPYQKSGNYSAGSLTHQDVVKMGETWSVLYLPPFDRKAPLEMNIGC